jgi:hypothetical protein
LYIFVYKSTQWLSELTGAIGGQNVSNFVASGRRHEQ